MQSQTLQKLIEKVLLFRKQMNEEDQEMNQAQSMQSLVSQNRSAVLSVKPKNYIASSISGGGNQSSNHRIEDDKIVLNFQKD